MPCLCKSACVATAGSSGSSGAANPHDPYLGHASHWHQYEPRSKGPGAHTTPQHAAAQSRAGRRQGTGRWCGPAGAVLWDLELGVGPLGQGTASGLPKCAAAPPSYASCGVLPVDEQL